MKVVQHGLGRLPLPQQLYLRHQRKSAANSIYNRSPMAGEIITLWRYRDLTEALFVQGKLADADLDSVLLDQNIVRLNWYWSNAVGGLRLQVAAADVQAAMEVLSDEIPASFTAEEVGEEYAQPACPECGSRDVDFRTFSRGWALVALQLLALPLPIPINKWKCQDCGHRWRAPYD